MTETSLQQAETATQVATDCEFVSEGGQSCGMKAAKGPFADNYQKYQERGWRGTLWVSEFTKSVDLPYGFTGYKFSDVWPDKSELHTWAHRKNTNIVLRMPRNVIGIDADQYAKKGHQKRGVDNLRALEQTLGELPPSFRSTRRGADNPSGIRFYRVPDSEFGWPGKVCDDVETVHHGHRFAVVWPSQVPDDDTGEILTYQWFTPAGHAMPGPPAVSDLPLLPKAWVDFLQKEHKSNGGVITSSSDFPDHVDIPDEVDHTAPWYMRAMARPEASGRGNDNLAAVIGGIIRLTMAAGEPFAVAQALALNYERASRSPQDDEVVVSMVERFWAQDVARGRDKPADKPLDFGGEEATVFGDLVRLKQDKFGFWVVNEEYTAETGWLGVQDDQFHMTKTVMVEVFENGEKVKVPEIKHVPVGDFHLEPTRRVRRTDGVAWRVKVINKDGELIEERQITDRELASERDLIAWVMQSGCSFTPKNKSLDLFISGSNLIRYLKSFDLPELEETNLVGWNRTHGCYVTPDGALFPGDSELKPFTDVIPSQVAVENCLMKYGFEVGIPEAREIAKKLFHAHDKQSMAMLYTFAALVALRGQYEEGTLFPALNVEAFSGSGKTSVIKRTLQLIGVTGGGQWTKAAMENTYSVARNGVVFVDDEELGADVLDLIRGAITGSTKNKMRAGDGSKRGGGQAVAATVLSSEGMTDWFNRQKANRDRFVNLKLPQAPDTRYDANPELSYYEGVVVPIENRFNRNLTAISGSVVSGLSGFLNLMGPLRGTSRDDQKTGYFKAMAPVVAAYLEMPEIVDLVDQFFEEQEDLGAASLVTLEVLPKVFRNIGRPERANNEALAMAMYLTDSGHIRVNAGMVSDIWAKIGGSRHRDAALADRTGIDRELDALGASPSKPIKVRNLNETDEKGGTVTERSIRYRELPLDISRKVVELANG